MAEQTLAELKAEILKDVEMLPKQRKGSISISSLRRAKSRDLLRLARFLVKTSHGFLGEFLLTKEEGAGRMTRKALVDLIERHINE